MTDPLPKWEMKAYAHLWNKYAGKDFYHQEACKLLGKKETVVSTLLYDLKKAGWLHVGLSGEDTRKRVYSLKSPQDAVRELTAYP